MVMEEKFKFELSYDKAKKFKIIYKVGHDAHTNHNNGTQSKIYKFNATNGITVMSDAHPQVSQLRKTVYIVGRGLSLNCTFAVSEKFLYKIFDAFEEFADNNFEWHSTYS